MINIKEMSREFNEVEQYLMTIAPSIAVSYTHLTLPTN